MTERLYRSHRDKMLGGVCGGLADYFNVDATLVRLIAALTVFMGGIGIPAYILAWIIIPENPHEASYYRSTRASREYYAPGGQGPVGADGQEAGFSERFDDQGKDQAGPDYGNGGPGTSYQQEPSYYREAELRRTDGKKVAGIILIVFGILFLLDEWLPRWFDFGKLWPLILIALGIAIIVRGQRR